MADDVVCLETPEPFYAVGQHYRRLRPGQRRRGHRDPARAPAIAASVPSTCAKVDEDVTIAFDGIRLPGHLCVPDGARGIVLFAHGSGSSRLSPRNVAVAKVLQGAGLGTLLFDLLSEDEADVRANVFDIELLAERLVHATLWLRARAGRRRAAPRLLRRLDGRRRRPRRGGPVPRRRSPAVVSRGGRPDLAGAVAGEGAGPDAAHRRRPRLPGHRPQPRGAAAPALHQPAGDRAAAPRTCSRSPARSRRPPAWRSRGSSATCSSAAAPSRR